MNKVLNSIGTVAGFLGILVCLVSALVRLAGSFHVGNYEAMSLFTAGIGLMVFAILAKVQALVLKQPR